MHVGDGREGSAAKENHRTGARCHGFWLYTSLVSVVSAVCRSVCLLCVVLTGLCRTELN
jgi:hypothetical protein